MIVQFSFWKTVWIEEIKQKLVEDYIRMPEIGNYVLKCVCVFVTLYLFCEVIINLIGGKPDFTYTSLSVNYHEKR